MRDEVIAFLILVVMCLGFGLNSMAVNDCSVSLSKQTENFILALEGGKKEEIQNCVDSLKTVWQKKQKNIMYTCRHAEIDEIEQEIFAAIFYAKNENYEKARFKAEKIQCLLDNLKKSEKMTFGNIF